MEALVSSICRTLDMIATPELFPTAIEVAKLKRWKDEIQTFTFQVSKDPKTLYTHGNEKRTAQGEPHDSGVVLFRFVDIAYGANCTPTQIDDAPIRIIVVDLLGLYHAAKLPIISKDGPRGRILDNLRFEEYIDNFRSLWYATRLHMIIFTCGDDFLGACARGPGLKTILDYGVNESLPQSLLEVQLKHECSCLHPFDMIVHVMWNYNDAEVHRLCNAIRDLHARIVTVKDGAA